jgi:Protein of unknown function (DUF3276)
VNDDRRFESVYSQKVRAGKRRTYFFDVRRTKGNDFYLTLTESTKKFNDDGFERHKIFLYKEDFNRFLGGLEDAINHVKTELMPDYDYEEFDRRQEEWEARKAAEYAAESSGVTPEATTNDGSAETSEPTADEVSAETPETASDDGSAESPEAPGDEEKKETTEDDMSW